MISLTNLPEDILITKILLKSDTNSLMNLRCVCKNFRSFITNPDFIKKHCHHQFNNNNNPLVLVYLKKNLFCSLSFNDIDMEQSCPEKVEISTPFRLPWLIGSCNGLLCLVDKGEIDQSPCLWNPSTKEYKKLPPPLPALAPVEDPDILTHYFTYGFGYDRIIDDYKVIQCDENFSLWDNSITEFQVYTLGTDTWRKIDTNPYESYCMISYNYHSAGMFVSGAVHWLGCLDRKFRIIAFDIEKEMFRAEVPIPRSRLIKHRSNVCSLNVLRGCLCIYEARNKYEVDNWVQMDVWMMKEYGVKDSWTKLFNIKDDYAFQYPSMYDFKVLKFCESGEFLVSMTPRDHDVLILYNPITKKCRKFEFGEITSFKGCMEIHIQSLVSLKTGIYMGRVKKQVLEGKTEDEYA